MTTDLHALLGDDADALLSYTAKAFPAEDLTLPGPDYLEPGLHRQRPLAHRAAQPRDAVRPRPPRRHRLRLDPAGRPGHRALGRGAASPRTRPTSTRRTCSSWPSRASCNAVATTLGALGLVSRRYVHRIPFIVKLNHNEFLHYPNTYDQIMFGSVRQAFDLGAVGVGATIYFGSDDMRPRAPGGVARPSPRRTSSACSPCCGATCATRPSRRTASTTRSRPT